MVATTFPKWARLLRPPLAFYCVATLSAVAASADAPPLRIEAEVMSKSGCLGEAPASAGFQGLRFFCNDDVAKSPFILPTIPGRYRITVHGASSTSTPAGISVYFGTKRMAALRFPGGSASSQQALADVPAPPSPAELHLVLESDDGSNDTDIDWVEIAHVGAIPPPPPAPSPPAPGAFQTGNFRNLFVEAGREATSVRAKLDTAWNRLFYGSDSEQRVYYPVGSDMAYILDVHNNDIRSEGVSYGMMIAVQMNKKTEFDRLWKFAKTKMQHQTDERRGYFAWQVRPDGSHIDPGSAPDGEEYFAMALFFASHRWGDGDGIYAYKDEANAILDAMLHQADDGLGVNMFDRGHRQVVFAPIGSAATFTDPSYHLPAFYELWARWADKDRDFWAAAADTSRAFFKRTIHPGTGLGPDYAEFSGAPNNTGGHGEFRFDAWRTGMNIAMDYAWFAADPWQKAFADTLLGFFHRQGMGTYANQYTLDGSPLSSDHSPGLAAMNATVALASTRTEAWDFVEAFWSTPPPSGRYRYYDGMLYLLGLLHVSGEFRIYRSADDSVPNPGSSALFWQSGRGGDPSRYGGMLAEPGLLGHFDIRGRRMTKALGWLPPGMPHHSQP